MGTRGPEASRWPRPEQIVSFSVGGLLCASGCLHVLVWLIDGGSLSGPISWRKPILFGFSAGVTVLSMGWVVGKMQQRFMDFPLLALFSVAMLVEVGLISLQQWRGVASHFNRATPFDTTVLTWIEWLILFATLVIAEFTRRSFRSLSTTPDMTLAINAMPFYSDFKVCQPCPQPPCLPTLRLRFFGTWSMAMNKLVERCGKSSLMKAGLLPRLNKETILPIYVESTAADTEVRLLKALRKNCPELPADASLTDLVARLRTQDGSRGRKVLIVLDQFEQWLHAHETREDSQLLPALRQCDGAAAQCIVMVRDDFWMSLTRFLKALEVPLLEGHNAAAVDLFHEDHAGEVLSAFGRAYKKLPELPAEPDAGQQQFLTSAVNGLATEGKVICVRLAVFAEMMKSRPWTPASLKDVGGAEGVGVSFLEETFSAKNASKSHRQHEQAVRSVLKAMLPEQGTDIKAEMQSHDRLLEASGYQLHPEDFEALLRILDSEVRLITPTEPDETSADDPPQPSRTSRHYQLTHDFLVPSMREWLTRKQRETRRGRAELRLEERSALFQAKPETRHLPGVLEWLNIWCWTHSRQWTSLQRSMMRKAGRFHLAVWGSALIVSVAAAFSVKKIMNLGRTDYLVSGLQAAEGSTVNFLLEELDKLPRAMVESELLSRCQVATGQQKLSLAYGRARFGHVDFDTILSGLTSDGTRPAETMNIVSALGVRKVESLKTLTETAKSATEQENWQGKARLAIVAWHLGDPRLASEMLRAFPAEATAPAWKPPDLLGDYQQQLDTLEKLSDEERKSPANRLQRAIANYYLGRHDAALEDLNELAAGKDVSAQVVQLQAVCLARNRDSDLARQASERLSEMTRSKSYAAYGAILVEGALGNLVEADRMLDALISEAPKDATTFYNAACIAAQLAKIQSAEYDRHKTQALGLLRRAYDLGFSGNADARTDSDFMPLHQDEDFAKLVNEIFRPTSSWDPVQRTRFIAEFPEWSGDLTSLATISLDDNPDLRSGVSLALGGVDRPSDEDRAAWREVLSTWYAECMDGGTHGAANWALRQWEMPLPTVEAMSQPEPGRDWWRLDDDLTMVRIRPGAVRGENSRVRVSQEFWLSNREVTVRLFQRFAEATKLTPKWEGPVLFKGLSADEQLDHPVQKVSWYDAMRFCNWLSGQHGLKDYYSVAEIPGKPGEYGVTINEGANGFRLPTEDQWEYACRAMTTTRFAFGDAEKDLVDYGVFGGNSESRTAQVGSQCCNAWGLFDMHGNVWEWCEDLWEWQGGSDRLARGGSWDLPARFCWSADRYGDDPSDRDYDLGFRVASVPSSPGAGGPGNASGAESESR